MCVGGLALEGQLGRDLVTLGGPSNVPRYKSSHLQSRETAKGLAVGGSAFRTQTCREPSSLPPRSGAHCLVRSPCRDLPSGCCWQELGLGVSSALARLHLLSQRCLGLRPRALWCSRPCQPLPLPFPPEASSSHFPCMQTLPTFQNLINNVTTAALSLPSFLSLRVYIF